MSDSLKIDIQNDIATVTLDNPDKHNAFDDALITEMTSTFNQINQDDSIRVMILAASGKSFSAGANLEWMRRMASYSQEENLKDARALAAMLNTLNTMAKPTIARVQGAAFGGAVGLVSCCDMSVATTRASFCLSEVKIGLIPATISPFVISAIGARAARRYFLTAERFTAIKALELGLVSEVCKTDELDASVERIVNALLSNSPAAISAAKKLVLDFEQAEINNAVLENASERIAAIRVSAEGQEGLNAFLEKRPAVWNKAV